MRFARRLHGGPLDTRDAPPFEDEPLARMQRALMELLDERPAPSARALIERMRADPAFEPYRAWVDQLDERGVETAALLVRRWARRAD